MKAILLLLGILIPAVVFAEFDPKIACKTMTKFIWQKNWASCAQAMKNAIDSKAVDANWMNQICDCATDDLINKASCQELKHFNEARAFQDAEIARITASCTKKFPVTKSAVH